MHRKTWLLFLLLIPLAMAIGIGTGIMFPSIFQFGSGSTTPSTGPRLGVHIEELKSGEELFELVGQKALAYKYSGGDVEFWIELDIDGKKQEVGLDNVSQLAQLAGSGGFMAPAPNQVIEGYFVCVRSDADDSGKENWTVAFRRTFVSAESSGLDDSAVGGGSVQVWKRKKPSGRTSKVTTSIPSPVPKDQEVCITTITESRGKKGEEGFEQHVIRVMCKVVSNKEKTEKAETPAQ
jgi:hypothetical protein